MADVNSAFSVKCSRNLGQVRKILQPTMPRPPHPWQDNFGHRGRGVENNTKRRQIRMQMAIRDRGRENQTLASLSENRTKL